MANSATNYTENLLLSWLLTLSSTTRPTNWYLALFTTATSDSTPGTEVSGTGYTRVPIQFQVTQTAGTTRARNVNTIAFTTAGSNWGTITHIGIFDASTGGNMLFHDAIGVAKQIYSGDTLLIQPQELTVSLE